MTCSAAPESTLTFTRLSYASLDLFKSEFDCSPHSLVTLDWLSSPFCLSRLLINSCRCSFPLSANKLHACSSSSLSGVLQCFHSHLQQWRTSCCCRPFDTTLQCLQFYHKSTCSVFSLATFFLPFASFLATALHLCHLISLFNATLMHSPKLCRRLATREPRFDGLLLLSNFNHHLSPSFPFP